MGVGGDRQNSENGKWEGDNRKVFHPFRSTLAVRQNACHLHRGRHAPETVDDCHGWMIIDEAFNADRLIEFLEALVKDASKKVFLILDNLRVHHSKPVKAWAAERQDKIELFYLPSYSPELNPEERLNANLKHAIGTKVPVRTKTKIKLAATEYMVKLEQSPERVKSFFQDPRVKYAA